MTKRSLSEPVKKQIAFSQHYKCKKCNEMLPSSYQIDHIIPHSISNDDSKENLVALCSNCHASKTQNERSRIIYYKKMKAEKKCDICYFCFSDKDKNHKCSNEYIDIPVNKKKPNELIDELYKYAHIPESVMYDKLKRLNLEKTDDVLRIYITYEYVHINNFFTKHDRDNLSPHELGNLIKQVVGVDRYKYKSVEIDINITDESGEDGGDKAIEYFSSLLPQEIPKDIFCVTEPLYIYYLE